MFKEILLAYDGSASAQHAAEYAKQLACKFKSHVHVVYAFGPIPRSMDESLREARIEQEINVGQAVISHVLAALDCADIIACGHILEGLPAEVILKHVERCSNDVIVMGSRGLGPDQRFLVGSVSDQVVHYATCPVLVAKREAIQEQEIAL